MLASKERLERQLKNEKLAENLKKIGFIKINLQDEQIIWKYIYKQILDCAEKKIIMDNSFLEIKIKEEKVWVTTNFYQYKRIKMFKFREDKKREMLEEIDNALKRYSLKLEKKLPKYKVKYNIDEEYCISENT